MNLLALQREFHAHLVDAPVASDTPFNPHSRIGLAVYHNAYRVQLVDCLGETYEQTRAWLGGAAFAEAARNHIAHSPPSSWTLGAYGEGFDRTLAVLYPDDPEVAELAQLEWMLSKAFEGKNADPLPASAIAEVDWDNAVLVFVPTLRNGPALTNAGAIWSAIAGGLPSPTPERLPVPGMMLVWRQGFTPCFRMIEALEHKAIMMASTGTSFADLCVMLAEMRGENDGIALAGQMLGQWFSDAMICEVYTKEMSCA